MTNDNGINDTVTDQELLSQVKFTLKIKDTNEHDAYLLQQINDGVRSLHNNFSLIPFVARLQINKTTLSAQLPKGFYQLNGQNAIRTFTESPDKSIAPSVPNDGFFKGEFNSNRTAQIVGNYIQFGSDVKDDYCEIAYLGNNVDSQGNIQIPRIADLCVRWYACYMYYLELSDPRFKEFKTLYLEQRRFVRGEYAKSDSQDNKRASEGFNKFNFNINTRTY